MKNFIFIFSVAIILCSCLKSQEDKANELIQADLRKTLIKPDSYKPIETTIDSAFSPYDDPVVLEKLTELAKTMVEINILKINMRSAKAKMAIWDNTYSSSLGKNRYSDAKEDYDAANSQFKKLNEKSRDLYKDVSSLLSQEPKFLGFFVTHNYRADNNAGNTLIGNTVYIIDKDFKRILFSCEIEEYHQYQEAIKQIEEQLEGE